MDRRRWLVGLGLLLALGCADGGDNDAADQGPVPDAPGKDAPGKDAPGADGPGTADSAPDKVPTVDRFVKLDQCYAGCHWDCNFSGIGCQGGKVYALGGGAVKCCTHSHPYPHPGPMCSTGYVLRTCASGACAKPDKRYHSPLVSSGPVSKTIYAHQIWLYCPASQSIKVGTSCGSDTDCRPAPVGTTRLVCDQASSKCALAARPAAPAGYGAGCGLSPAGFSYKPSSRDRLVKGATCSLCHAVLEPGQSCVRQACTTTCKYDEDCPAASVCLYGWGTGFGVCAAGVTDRTTYAGRSAGLSCPPTASDAGPG